MLTPSSLWRFTFGHCLYPVWPFGSLFHLAPCFSFPSLACACGADTAVFYDWLRSGVCLCRRTLQPGRYTIAWADAYFEWVQKDDCLVTMALWILETSALIPIVYDSRCMDNFQAFALNTFGCLWWPFFGSLGCLWCFSQKHLRCLGSRLVC